MAFTLPPLPYAYNALEPHIDEQTMRIHHDKHHDTYVNNLNAALEPHPDLQKKSLEELLARARQPARGDPHAGAQQRRRARQPHDVLGDDGARRRQGAVRRAGRRDHQGVRRLQPVQGAVRQGLRRPVRQRLGLAGRRQGGKLAIESTPNQDSPLMSGKTPILGCDVWEHAYYLKYQNRRPDYVDRLVERGQLDRCRHAVRAGGEAVTASCRRAPLPAVGSPAPDFTLPSTAGTDVTLSSAPGEERADRVLPAGVHQHLHHRALLRSPRTSAQFQRRDTVVLPISVDSVPTLGSSRPRSGSRWSC